MNNIKSFSPHELLFDAYGRTPPVQALVRLQTELIVMSRNFMDDITLVSRLRKAAKEAGSELNVTGTFGGSLIAWLYGCTDVNPLPPHYRCPVCKRAVFFSDGDGWDLPTLECCGQPLYPDGHDIPVESVLPVLECAYNSLHMRTTKAFAERAEAIIWKHYKRQYSVIPYEEEDTDYTAMRGYVLIPAGEAPPEPNEYGVWQTNMEELYEKDYRTIRMYFSEAKEQLEKLHGRTAGEPTLDELRAKLVMTATEAKITELIKSEGGVLLNSDGLTFSSLLKLKGYLHSTHTDDNPVYEQEDAKLGDVFTCREDVWHLVKKAMNPEYGISDRFAEKIMGYTRRGRFTRNRMEPETELTLRSLGIEDRWIAQMKHTGYLPPKADLIASLLDELKLSWYLLKTEETSEQKEEVQNQ